MASNHHTSVVATTSSTDGLQVHVDRSEWRRNVLKGNPEINNLCERVYPMNRGILFGKQFNPGKQEVKQRLSRDVVIQLILQHLQTKGLKQTKAMLEKESKISTPSGEGLNESRLVTFIRKALRDSDRVYDLSMEHAEYGTEEKQAKMLEREELLYQMDLLEDEDEGDGVNIWEEPVENIIIDSVRNTEDDQDEEVVKSGSLNKLVERLTHESKVDLQFLKTFLMTYQSFCTPEKLLNKLVQRYNVPKHRVGTASIYDETNQATRTPQPVVEQDQAQAPCTQRAQDDRSFQQRVHTQKVKARARMMTRFIKIADHLRQMHNYNSLMAIIAGLNFSSVYRLKFTRDELSQQIMRTYGDLEKIMNSESSFKAYRTRLAASSPPALPYLGVHLTDLTFMEENPDLINMEVAPNKKVNLINFTKRTLVFKVISQIQQYQQLSYNLQPVHQIQEFLLNIKSDYKGQSLDLYQQDLYRESLRREPRKAQRSDIQ
ncbi:Ras guanine nucleotide exchange factor [Cavenderia fasciculata]|uniref:Ras guanine nucleotide exchange factor n=1 Tax=Cavenderia fasciculata TaxID=261658 RepID=F4Q0R4_CACFS|nr:Ras guanine nucleotide exchange factor [Cavenderia fasciculata]EGG18415.1 Ras guanine nucleotide exchange factor [Cavenderia fasciculata]|eukprot:XP_004366319.1 Ras guanine nucleotide exchange factor [Cavenderia fasciculata]